MNILGISAFYHDSAAALVRDGAIVAAAQEERFTRRKHDPGFPAQAAAYCLREGGIEAADLDLVAFYDKPFLKFERLLETYLAFAPRGLLSFWEAMPLWIKEKLWLPEIIKKELDYQGRIVFPEHHQSHAASAFFPSPFARAAVITLDGVGEWTTTSYGLGEGNRVDLLAELKFPHSLGLLYSAFTYFTGFKVNSGEYKVMGLAPYGEPRYADLILERIMDLKDDGSFKLDMRYFNFCQGLTMTNRRFAELFGGPPRSPESPLTQREMDLAASVQQVTELAVERIVREAHRQTGESRLCLAGGVALNCVANGKVLREGPFREIWIQPAAGDAGGALGAALFAWHHTWATPVRPARGWTARRAPTWAPPTRRGDRGLPDAHGLPARRVSWEALPREAARLIADQKVVGWLEGRMEFGPRALGARSILGDARSARMQSVMNLKIKYRESFRPFAPSVLAERVGEYFELSRESPYMLLVAGVNPAIRREMTAEETARFGIEKLNTVRSSIPAVTHVDYSARVQTVHAETNPLYHALLRAFEELTGCGVIVNTSFNVRGEPIVRSPAEAYACFMRTEMDHLVMGPFILDKADQPAWHEEGDWRSRFELD